MDSSVPGRLDRVARRAMDALVGTKQSLADAYCRAQSYAVDTFARLASRSNDFGRRASSHADRIRREHPLQLLAVIGGAAIALGIVARVRRSRHYEELKEIAQLRIEMFKANVREKIKILKIAAPLAGLGIENEDRKTAAFEVKRWRAQQRMNRNRLAADTDGPQPRAVISHYERLGIRRSS